MQKFFKVLIEIVIELVTHKKAKEKVKLEQKRKENLKRQKEEYPLVSKLYPRIQEQLYNFLDGAKELDAYIFEGLRTFERQTKLYAKGRNSKGKIINKKKVVTNTKAGYSFHNYGLACDIVCKDKKGNWTWQSQNWQKLGELGEQFGFTWGGRWKGFPDSPHFQITYGKKTQELLQCYKEHKSITDVWNHLDSA